MNILQICNKVPYPPKDGGAIAMLTLSEAFADFGHKVTVLAMNTKKHQTDLNSIPEKYSQGIKFKYFEVDTDIKPVRLLWNFLFSSFPYIAERFLIKDFGNELKKTLLNNQFDIIQIEGLYLLPYIPLVRKYSKAKVAYRAHNIENEIWTRIASETSNPFKRVYLLSLAKRLKKFETGILNSYDFLIPITNRDADILNSMGNKKHAYVCSVGIPSDNFCQPAKKNIANSLFYIGSLDWIPNQEAVCWFIDSVWPALMEQIPDISFHIAGRNSPEWLQKKCSGKNIVFHGEIDNAHNFFDSYQIMVVPLFAGSGMRVKIIEAMARSKVVITTTIGAEGLEAVNGLHLIVEDSATGFIQQIKFLLENSEYFAKIEHEAFNVANAKYNSKSIAEGLINFYLQHSA